MNKEEKLKNFRALHAKLRELEQFVNPQLGKPDAVTLRYPECFQDCHVSVTDDQFVRGVFLLAKRRIKQIQNEILKISDL